MHPVLLTLGSWELRSYGAALFLGVVIGAVVFIREGRRLGFPSRSLVIFVVGAALCGLVGGRLNAWIFFMDGTLSVPNPNIFSVRGGLTSFGGVAAAVVFGAIYARRHGWRMWAFLDLMAPIIPLVEGFNRFGCLLNGCCFGRATGGEFAMYLPDVQGFWTNRYPTQLLLIALNFALAGWLWQRRRDRPFDGSLILSYLIVYHVGRIAIDGLRGDQPVVAGMLTAHQVAAMLIVVMATVTMWFKWEHVQPAEDRGPAESETRSAVE